jgi:hypothetical protein
MIMPSLFFEIPKEVLTMSLGDKIYEVRYICVIRSLVEVDTERDEPFDALTVRVVSVAKDNKRGIYGVLNSRIIIPCDFDDLNLAYERYIEGEDSFEKFFVYGEEVDSKIFAVRVICLVVNAIFYLSTHKPSAKVNKRKGKRKKESLRDKVRSFTVNEEWIVGTEIELSEKLREGLRNVAVGNGKKISFKFSVGGYHRRQWYGKKINGMPGTFQKVIWVGPYEKGKELEGRVMGHTYKQGNTAQQ